MSNTNSNTLLVSNGHVDSLIKYVLDVKPYHTKLSAVVERYLFEDNVNVKIAFDHSIVAFLGADILPAVPTNGARPRRASSWFKEIFSDGQRRTWPAPTTAVHKFASHAGRENFTVGIEDQYDGNYHITGLTKGVFNPVRWDGPGITEVRLNDVHQQDTIDYFLSRGVHSFDTITAANGSKFWKQTDIVNQSAFSQNPGEIFYAKVDRVFGTISQIKSRTINPIYEEWIVTCTTPIPDLNDPASVLPTVLSYEVTDSKGVSYGSFTAQVVGSIFIGEFGDISNPDSATAKPINFRLTSGPGLFPDDIPYPAPGQFFSLTPFNKVTVAPDAPEETWSLIKTNPINLINKPQFNSVVVRSDTPGLEVHTVSLDEGGATTWSVEFTSTSAYFIKKTIAGSGTILATADLKDGCSFKSDAIHFTIIPGLTPFVTGDVFNFTTAETVANYKVFGSVSGWQADATIGQWYWNGKVGFKIPKLEYAPMVFNSTIVSTVDATDNSWQTIVSNNQILRGVSFNQGLFFVAGDQQIAGVSANGTDWTSDISTIFTPDSANSFLTIVGEDGFIATSNDGAVWVKQGSNTTNDLYNLTVIPDLLSSSVTTNTIDCVLVVGQNGTILTSANGIGWSRQNSGTNADLKSITWSVDCIIAVGRNGTILRSTDRLTWVPQTSPLHVDLHSVIHDGIAFIAAGDNGTIIRSLDGINWTLVSSYTSGNYSSVAYGNGKYLAVGNDGWTGRSADGISWTRYFGKKLNAIAFGNGIFIGVGGRENAFEQFIPHKNVHSIAEPSVYTIKFLSGDRATVEHNINGFKRGLIPNNEPKFLSDGLTVNPAYPSAESIWSDEWISFHLDAIPGVAEYQAGDEIKVYLAPFKTFPITTAYDETFYDETPYDLGVGEIRRPWLFNQEYFPLYHSYGAVIFPTCSVGDKVIIDKATKDDIRFKIAGASSNYAELSAINDWVPLEFRYFDRVISSIPTSTAEFSDLTTYIEAYLASNPSVRVFSIAQPRYKQSNKNASAVLTFDQAFFNTYMGFNTQYSLQFLPDASYGQRVRVKITENFRTFAKIRINLSDIISININDQDIRFIDIVTSIDFIDSANISFVEGGALPVDAGYDEFPYDIFQYDERILNGVISGVVEVSPGVYDYTGSNSDWIIPKPTVHPSTQINDSTVEIAGTSFGESLLIQEKVAGVVERLSTFYDFNKVSPQGMLIEMVANEYVVSHNGPASSPNLIVESINNPGVIGNPVPNMFPILNAPLALSLKSFSFSLPVGFTAPFRLTIV